METPQQGLICVAIGRATVDEALAAAEQAEELADVIEIRLDALDAPAIGPFVQALQRPLLFTNRPVWEGGQWDGAETARVELLVEAMRANVAYVDLELLAPGESFSLLKAARTSSSTRLIVSNHNFQETPSAGELHDILRAMKSCGADIGKIITTAHTPMDVLRVLHLQEEAAEIGLPLIAFCMGRAGVISRLATIELGGYMTYCTVSAQEATAPGQIPVGTMRTLLTGLFGNEG